MDNRFFASGGVRLKTKILTRLLLIGLIATIGSPVQAGFLDDLKSDLKKIEKEVKTGVEKFNKDIKKKETATAKNKSAPSPVEKSRPSPEESSRAKARTTAPTAPAAATAAPTAATGPAVAAQSATTPEQTKRDSSPSSLSNLPWKGELSSPKHDVYGWFDSYHLQIVNPKGHHPLESRMGDSLYGTIRVGPRAFSLSGEFTPCEESFNDNLEYLGAGKTAKDIKSKLLLKELEKYDSYKGQLVKFNNVRIVNGYFSKGQICAFSSITKADIPPKTTARFTLNGDASSIFLNVNVIGNSSGRFLLPTNIGYIPSLPEKSTLKFDPIYVSCGSGYSWSSSKNFKKIKKRFKNGEFDNINAADIELIGVALTEYQRGMCTVDSIKVRKLN